MARQFDGINDVLTADSTTALSGHTTLSIACTFVQDGDHEVAGIPRGYMGLLGPIANFEWLVYIGAQDTGTGSVIFDHNWNGAQGEWRTPLNSVADGTVYRVVATYNGGSTSNDPLIYLNGVSQSITEVSTPSGSLVITATPQIDIGNRRSDTNRTFNGSIEEFAIWGGAILDQGEVTALSKGYSARMIRPNSLVFYAPLWGNDSPEPELINGYALSETGTTKKAHQRLILPKRRRIFTFPTAAVGGANLMAAIYHQRHHNMAL